MCSIICSRPLGLLVCSVYAARVGANQDFVREIGAQDIIATDNSQTQTGRKWETTSRNNITKQRKFSPHNQNQNMAERRIQDAKHRIVYVLEKSSAPILFWCYALIHVIDCLNYHAKPSLNWKTSYEMLNGDTPDISAFRFSFWQEIEYFEPTAKCPEARWKPGRILGIAWDSGDAFTFKVWTQKDGWAKGRELTRNIVRARRVLPPSDTTHDSDLDSFYFNKKVYTNKRRGRSNDRIKKLVRIEDREPDDNQLIPHQEELHSNAQISATVIPFPESSGTPPSVLPIPPADINQEEK